MADLTGVLRWNANFVRGLAQSVLERARNIRTTLSGYTASEPLATSDTSKPKTAAKQKVVRAKKSTAGKAKPKPRAR